jgi:hypothetical protein
MRTSETDDTYKMEPDGPTFRYNQEGITLSMSEIDLQCLAIMARVFQAADLKTRLSVPGFAYYSDKVDELAAFIDDAT